MAWDIIILKGLLRLEIEDIRCIASSGVIQIKIKGFAVTNNFLIHPRYKRGRARDSNGHKKRNKNHVFTSIFFLVNVD